MKKALFAITVLSMSPSMASAQPPHPDTPEANPRTCWYFNGYVWIGVPCFVLGK